MEFIKKETFYHYKFTEAEKLSLIGILSMLDNYGEISGLDNSSKETVNQLLKALSR